jgi:signal transduction histidine kinase
VVALVMEAAPLLTMETNTGEVRIVIRQALQPTNWLSAAAFAPITTGEIDQQLARMLHDMKNEINAARVALREVPTTRTEQLEVRLSASKHLDQAAALASRLVAADRLMSDQDLAGETDLPSFFRSYVRDALGTLPDNVRLLPPPTTPALVALGPRALRTILDNLIKNAGEAMPDGGDVKLDYIVDHEDGKALIEVTDTGPGIPSHVITEVCSGHAVPSTKKQGSGIGLVGVLRLISRIGGSMEPVSGPLANGWSLTIPIANAEPVGGQ